MGTGELILRISAFGEQKSMDTLIATARNVTIFAEQDRQPLEASSMLLLTMLGKVFLNLFVFGSERKNVKPSFLRYFSFSVALADFILLLTISFIAYFQDGALFSVRFTKYHICLFTQIVSFTYGVMHYPVFFVAGLDYFIVITPSSRIPSCFRRSLYVTAVLVLWVITVYYVLTSPTIYSSLEINSYFSFQCPFYISHQSFWLSLAILFIVCAVVMFCWVEFVTLLQSLRIVSHVNEHALLFSFATSRRQTKPCKRHLLTCYMMCFLGAWLPFIVLQMVIVFLNAEIPAYMDMNVPWLYFLNSFLIGAAHWIKQRDLEFTDLFISDPFVSWHFRFSPFVINEHSKQAEMLLENSVVVTVV
ncbi:probable G-protein coupled receptor 160 isoform X1 [Ambystoma mexicanum]|uniref:probable G-protein coupled receptor 160 isoform X1 n=1 Tax=Ambystoma mexicanum TaxID=8296 RepID=UPI0037E92318